MAKSTSTIKTIIIIVIMLIIICEKRIIINNLGFLKHADN